LDFFFFTQKPRPQGLGGPRGNPAPKNAVGCKPIDTQKKRECQIEAKKNKPPGFVSPQGIPHPLTKKKKKKKREEEEKEKGEGPTGPPHHPHHYTEDPNTPGPRPRKKKRGVEPLVTGQKNTMVNMMPPPRTGKKPKGNCGGRDEPICPQKTWPKKFL